MCEHKKHSIFTKTSPLQKSCMKVSKFFIENWNNKCLIYYKDKFHIWQKKKYTMRPDLKIYWFDVTWPGLQETCRSKKNLMLIPEKHFFSHNYIILAMLTPNSKANFLFILLYHFLVVCVVLTSLTHCPLCTFQ